MSLGILRSDKSNRRPHEMDDNGNLFVTGGGGNAPTLAGASTTGAATELVVGSTAAAAANNQTLAGAAGKRTYIAGFFIDGLGATGATNIAVTITGLLGGVTLTFNVAIPAGASVALTRFVYEFSRPIPASADNTAIVVNVPSYGAGNLTASAGAHGFQI